MLPVLSIKSCLKCFLRSGMLNFLYTEQGLQSIGFLYALMPGLRDLYRDDRDFSAACARYSRRFNCNAFWAPFLVGSFLHLECRMLSEEGLNRDFMAPLIDTTLNTLSAIGDSFFNGSLLVSLILSLSCLVLLQDLSALGPLILLCLFLSLFLKIFLFYIGLSRGLTVLRRITGLNLVNKGDYLKVLNAVLLAAFLALALAPAPGSLPLSFYEALQFWFLPVLMLLLLDYGAARLHIARTPVLVLFFLLAALVI
jgi:PTS system mannose-specific IID component